MDNQNLKSIDSCAINNGEDVAMCVCWHMFDPKYREALFLIAGLARREYLPLMHTAWEYMPIKYRARVMAVLNGWKDAKNFDLGKAEN